MTENKRLRIINSETILPDSEHYVITFGADELNQTGKHSNEYYIGQCHDMKRGTLVYRR